jgi:hypothetical protein
MQHSTSTQPASITNIAFSEVVGFYYFTPGYMTVRTTRWGACVYSWDAEAKSYFTACLSQPL